MQIFLVDLYESRSEWRHRNICVHSLMSVA